MQQREDRTYRDHGRPQPRAVSAPAQGASRSAREAERTGDREAAELRRRNVALGI